MHLVTTKSFKIPGISNGIVAIESLFELNDIRKMMGRHYEI